MTPQPLDLTIRQRTAIVVYAILTGQELSTIEVAEKISMTRQGAWAILDQISIVLPIYQDDNGIWRKFDGSTVC